MKVEELNDLFAAPEDVVEVINEEVEETGNNGVDDSPEDGDTNKTEEVTNEETNEVIDTTSVYNILKDYNLAPEIENPTEEQIREHLENFGSTKINEFFSNKPSRFQDLTAYVLAKDNVTDEDLDDFYNKYLKKEAIVEINSVEDARKFLENSKTFAEAYDDIEDLKEALDLLEDRNKIVAKAKSLYEKQIQQETSTQEAERKAAIKAAEDAKQAKLESSKIFATKVQEELKTLSWKEEQKNKAIQAASQDNINKVWGELVKNPRGYIQFANLLTYFKDGNFDTLYEVLEGKQTSKQISQREKEITKDTIGSLLGKSKQPVKTGDLSDLFSPA